jgi:hypothetical protein
MEELWTSFNFLLPFAGRDELLRMGDNERAALAGRVAAAGASASNWRALLELLASWPKSQAKNEAIARLDGSLHSWSDELRSLNSSWTYIYSNNALAPLAQLARVITIAQREDRGNLELKRIAGSPYAASIKKLVMQKSSIAPSGITALGAGHLNKLTELSMEGLTVGADGYDALFGIGLPSLESLRLKDSGLGVNRSRSEGLMRSRLIAPVLHLDISRNALGDEDAQALAASDKIKDLETLSVAGNYIRDAGAKALLRAATGGRIKEIDLSGNGLSSSLKAEAGGIKMKI